MLAQGFGPLGAYITLKTAKLDLFRIWNKEFSYGYPVIAKIIVP